MSEHVPSPAPPGPERQSPAKDSPSAGATTAQWSHSVGSAAGVSEITPNRIGRYTIRRRLAAGGMGVVYEAEQDQPRRLVALKVMRPGRDSTASLERFRREAEILGRLRHPGIAQVFEAGTHKDEAGAEVPYFVMEFLPGARTITRYAEALSLDVRSRLELLARVCDAVEHAHRAGVVHRDIKPDNILVDDTGHPKVIDFGIARAPASVVTDSRILTMPETMIGTLAYMSPEQWTGDPAQVDTATDVYALGATLYELLTGKSAHNFENLSLAQMGRIVREEAPARPSAHVPSLRGDLDVIVLKAMHLDRGRRYSSAEELGEDIKRWLESRPIEARTDEAIYRIRVKAGGFFARHSIVAWALGSIAAAAVSFYLGAPLFHRWTRWGGLAEGLVIRAAPSGIGLTEPVDSVRVIALGAGADLGALARDAGVPGVDAAEPTSGRRLHGRLMERLAGAPPRVVVFEIAFPRPSPHDDSFIVGAQALARAGVPLVVGVRTWELLPSGGPVLMSLAFRPFCTWGVFSAGLGANAPWRLDMAVKRRAQGTLPSLALSTLAAAEGFGARVVADLDESSRTISLRAWEPSAEAVGGRRVTEGGRLVQCSAVYSHASGDPEFGIASDDVIAAFVVEPPSDQDAAAITIDYAAALRMTDADLSRAVGGKIVLVSDHRSEADLRTTPGGRRLRGTYAHTAGIQALLQDSAIVIPREYPVTASLHALAFLGGAIGARYPWRHRGRWIRLAVLTLLIVAVSVALFAGARVLIGPLVPVTAMVLGAEMTAAILRMRTGQ